MSVRFYYVDESYDDERFVLSAVGIRATHWRSCVDAVAEHRRELQRAHGFFTRKEIHARELVAGKGRVSKVPIGKFQRSQIFAGLLKLVASLPEVRLINVCLQKSGRKDPQLEAWDRLVNRLEKAAKANEAEVLRARRTAAAQIAAGSSDLLGALAFHVLPRAALVADEGREREIRRAFRRMAVFNHIPSRFGAWPDGARTQNIPTTRFVEEPFFRRSEDSHMIQLADCVAFSLLKREAPPTDRIAKYGIDKMFDAYLAPVCHLPASRADPLGIVRK